MGKSWKNPHKVAAAQKKGAIFTKLAREIAVAAKLGGPDPEGNARLKMAINAARTQSCPKDTIERAIKKGSGQLDDGTIIEELTYEGYGPHQVGIIVDCQSDNKNRTVSDIRAVFKKNGGNLGESGSVAWMFSRVAIVEGSKDGEFDPEEEAIEAGANEVEDNGEGGFSFYGEIEDLDGIRTTLSDRGWEVTVAELGYKAQNKTDVTEEQREEVVQLLELLDDNEDTHRIYSTID
ncbi:MAG: YebC/PmpR family DNA-binding transcriptional regulator [Bdellovibrionales bacterium]|nr:YebC/PmpR family DNA-binding transcriptional regulator [Bdellovibrionales bacterium]